MSEDHRAHERIDGLEGVIRTHLAEHSKFERSLAENTEMTKQIAANTAELVTLVKGAKGLRSFVVWFTPIAIAIGVVWAWIKEH